MRAHSAACPARAKSRVWMVRANNMALTRVHDRVEIKRTTAPGMVINVMGKLHSAPPSGKVRGALFAACCASYVYAIQRVIRESLSWYGRYPGRAIGAGGG
jgi:hypothetical protein